jgi:hypothetical protein
VIRFCSLGSGSTGNATLIEATRGRADLVVPSAVLEAIGAPPSTIP